MQNSLISSSCLGQARISGGVDTAVIPFNVEKSFFSPGCVPRVGTNPVVEASLVIMTPSNKFNCMTSQELSSYVVIDSTCVVHEVLINIESGFNWTVGLNFSLNSSNCVTLLDCATCALVFGPASFAAS